MPRKQVNGFTGEPVYGTMGEYRYDHPSGAAVWVAEHPDNDTWQVGVAEDAATGEGTRTIEEGLKKKAAFNLAYSWMEQYTPGSDDYGEFGVFR